MKKGKKTPIVSPAVKSKMKIMEKATIVPNPLVPLIEEASDSANLDFMKESFKRSAKWQFFEWQDIEFKDRLEIDREAFKEYYYSDSSKYTLEYSEIDFLELLISIYKGTKDIYYFKYRKFLKSEKAKLLTPSPSQTEILLEETTPSHKLTIPELALKLFYENCFVNRNNAQSFLTNTKHTSGDALYNKYTFWTIKANRLAMPDPPTTKKIRNKIKLFENVANSLSQSNKEIAESELTILRSHEAKM